MARRLSLPPVEEGQLELAEHIYDYADDPLEFVLFAYPWGEEGTPLADKDGPDTWQARVLLDAGRQIKAGNENALAEAIRIAVVSGHGVGKTALVAWIIHWFISTRPNPQIICTANTVSQLTGKTWRELAKWKKLAINGDWFQWTATRYYLKGQPDTWFAQAVPWSKERAEAFAGTHEEHVLLIFDEASAIEDTIWEVAEGALTTHGAMWFAFGNGTRNTGRFRECFRKFRHRWRGFHVDSRTAKMTNKGQIAAWIADYGEDSDFVRVRVKGEFPRASSTQFIGQDLVEGAMERFRRRANARAAAYRGFRPDRSNSGEMILPFLEMDWGDNPLAPMILSLDVARFGDDSSVLGALCGDVFRILRTWREMDDVQLAAAVAPIIDELKPDAVVVDSVGVGASAVDQLKVLGYDVIEANAGMTALEQTRYFNRRAEMYDKVRAWLKNGGMIEPVDQLGADLTAIEYGFDGKNRIQLEAKEDMKARGLPSPDYADTLSLAFWMPFAPRKAEGGTVRDKLARLQVGGDGSWMGR